MGTRARELKALNARHEVFVRLVVVDGRTASDAYREVFYRNRKAKDATIWTAASELMAQPLIRQRVQELQTQAAQAAVFTIADHLRNLHDLVIKASASKDWTAAVRAERSRGEAAGFYAHIQRHEHTGKDGKPIESRQLRDMTDAELIEECKRHGIDPAALGYVAATSH